MYQKGLWDISVDVRERAREKNVKKNNTHIYNNIKSFNYTLWEKTFGLNSSP